jgi:lactoylglutathione lyase
MRPSSLLVTVGVLCSVAPFLMSLHAAEDAAGFNGLAHIQIATPDIERTIRFYQDNLHFVVVDRTEVARPTGTMRAALIRQGSCILEIMERQTPEGAAQPAAGPIGHFALLVGNVDKAVAELKAKGVKFDREPSTNEQLFGGIRTAFITGPSGERIELFQFLNPASKGAQAK